jgi:hypothetical protein
MKIPINDDWAMLAFSRVGFQNVVARTLCETFYCRLAVDQSDHDSTFIRRCLLPNENQITVFDLFITDLGFVHRIATDAEKKIVEAKSTTFSAKD